MKHFILLMISVFLFKQELNAQKFTVKGMILQNRTGYVLLSYRDSEYRRKTSLALLKDGKFQFSGQISGTTEAYLETDTTFKFDGKRSYTALIFLEPGKMKAKLIDGDLMNAKIIGSIAQIQYLSLRQSELKEINEIRRLSFSIDSIEQLLKDNKISSNKTEIHLKRIKNEFSTITSLKINREVDFIKKNKKSFVSLFLLKYLTGYISVDSIDALYLSLSDYIKGGNLDKSFLENYTRFRKAIAQGYSFDKLQIDSIAPRFRVYNLLSKQSFSNEDFLGSVVLIDFWSLSCLPCLRQNQDFEEMRRRFNSDRFKIISVCNSSDNEIPKLITYINKNSLEDWFIVIPNIQRNIKNLYVGDFNDYYGIAVPRTILIGKDGRVIYKSYGYSQEDIQNLINLIKSLLKR